VGEGGRVGTVQEGVGFITHDLDGTTRGAIALVVGGVCVVIGKVEVGWDVGGGLGSERSRERRYYAGLKRSRRWRSSRAM